MAGPGASKQPHSFVLVCLLLAVSSGIAAAGGEQAEPNYGPAKGCTPPTLPVREPLGVRIRPMPAGKRPNFVVVLTDDQGYDDIGLHQPQKPGGRPQWVSTPNLDKFLQQSQEFSNFYVAPMCAQTRAELLTGRSYQRTGTMLINGGYDYVNRAEATLGHVLGEGGYKTAHFGKWHNGRTLGYEPWEMGFQESWLPTSHVHLDNLMRHNGVYVQTKGLMEQDLMDTVLSYLKRREDDDAPFVAYYAPHAIHQGFLRPGQGPRWQRPAPEPYKSKYKNMTPKLAGDTADVWGMLEYMDDVLGRLFDFMDASKLRDNTYVLLMGDNGAELFPGERTGYHRARRMPSGMQGYKKSVEEGGVRNYLAVKGPGVRAGVIDDTLMHVTDVLPTLADLAGVRSRHMPWDGLSFANLLQTGAPSAAQEGRIVYTMSPHCWSPDSVPDLGRDRRVAKPQRLLDFEAGGVDGRGFKRCIGARLGDYKWLGESGRVFRIHGDNHVELPCNEVRGEEKERVVRRVEVAVREWWASLLAEPHSFNKPTFQLGLGSWSVTNILPDGAHERTPGRIELLQNGAAGFSRLGDTMCFAVKVLTAGSYKVNLLYTSRVQAQFRVTVGSFADIEAGKAAFVHARLPSSSTMSGFDMGSLTLDKSEGQLTEACLTMVASSSVGSPVFDNLSNIRFTLEGQGKGPAHTREGAPPSVKGAIPTKAEVLSGKHPRARQQQQQQAKQQAKQQQQQQQHHPDSAEEEADTPGSLYAYDWITPDSPLDPAEEEEAQMHPFLAASPAMRRAERDAMRAAAVRKGKESGRVGVAAGAHNATEAAWQQLRQTYLWPEGQTELESLFSPYESEGIYTCSRCQPDV